MIVVVDGHLQYWYLLQANFKNIGLCSNSQVNQSKQNLQANFFTFHKLGAPRPIELFGQYCICLFICSYQRHSPFKKLVESKMVMCKLTTVFYKQ